MDKRELLLEGLNQPYQPVPVTKVSQFLRDYKRGYYYAQTKLQAWETFLEKFNQDWYLRYGLNMGYSLIEVEPKITGSWDSYGYTMKIGKLDEMVSTRNEPFTMTEIVKLLQEYCLTYKAKYDFKSIDFQNGRFSFDDYPQPQWDWLKWRASAILRIQGTKLNRYYVDCLIGKFKREGMQGIHPDEALQQKLNEVARQP